MKPDNITKPVSRTEFEKHLPLAGRFLIAPIFLASGVLKVTDRGFFLGYTESVGLLLASVGLTVSVVVELTAGTMLAVGYRSRLAVVVLVAHIIPTALIFHQFWLAEPAQFSTELVSFTKNLAVAGGLVVLRPVGSGSVSVDSFRTRDRKEVGS